MSSSSRTATPPPRSSLDAARRSGERRRTGSSASTTDRRKRHDQVVQHLFIKTVHVLLDARLTRPTSFRGTSSDDDHAGADAAAAPLKTDRWFNLELEDFDVFRDELRTWKGISALLFPATPSPSASATSSQTLNYASVPTLVLDVVIDLADVAHHRCLVLTHGAGTTRSRVDAVSRQHSQENAAGNKHRLDVKSTVVLERWTASLIPPMPAPPGPELPTVYRHAISQMRALYTLVRTLPVWHLQRRLRKSGSRDFGSLKLGCRLSSGEDHGDVGVQDALFNGQPGEPPQTFTFEPIQTPLGSFQTSVAYRSNVDFSITDKEAMLSIDEDFFKPNKALDTTTGQRPGSVPVKLSQRPVAAKLEAGSWSSGRLLGHAQAASTQRVGDAGPSSSLTAAMKAAEATPAFIHPSSGPGQGSTLTARLNSHGKVPPTSAMNIFRRSASEGVPFPSQSTPPTSEALARTISSSPRSGPSSSIGISQPQRPMAATESPRSPALASSGGNAIAGPSKSPLVSGAKPMPMPLMRRYSSSRTSRSYGQGTAGSSPSGSLGAMDIGSISRRSRLSLDGPTGSPLDIYAGASLSRMAQRVEGAGEEEKAEIKELIQSIDFAQSLHTTSRSMSSSDVDETLRKFSSSFHSSDPGTLGGHLSMSVSPDTGGSLGGSPSGGRPLSWRASNASGSNRPSSAFLDNLREEDEEPHHASSSKHQVFVPSSLGKYANHSPKIKPSPLSASPSGGGGSLPRYVSNSRRSGGRSNSSGGGGIDAIVTTTTSGLSNLALGTHQHRSRAPSTPPLSGFGSSFEDGPVGKMELSEGG